MRRRLVLGKKDEQGRTRQDGRAGMPKFVLIHKVQHDPVKFGAMIRLEFARDPESGRSDLRALLSRRIVVSVDVGSPKPPGGYRTPASSSCHSLQHTTQKKGTARITANCRARQASRASSATKLREPAVSHVSHDGALGRGLRAAWRLRGWSRRGARRLPLGPPVLHRALLTPHAPLATRARPARSPAQQPTILLLREGTDSSQGKAQLISNINAISAVVDILRTTLGPRGMDKLIRRCAPWPRIAAAEFPGLNPRGARAWPDAPRGHAAITLDCAARPPRRAGAYGSRAGYSPLTAIAVSPFSDGVVTISNDGATLMKLLDIVHPAAKTLVDIARSQDAEVGDGTTSVVVLAGELLREAKPFVEDGVHAQVSRLDLVVVVVVAVPLFSLDVIAVD
ncbi:hypothetical protein T492DRAFT_836131 [Pavlovales sp. CCMP2436]|nr:hypothetical protein T492DRAFT_836131 [Pavlovales sp. CCMP2436]